VIDTLAALIVAENKWLPLAMTAAAVSVAILIARHRRSGIEATRLVMAAMNLFAGVMLATMGTGHMLAVTTKLLFGTLEGSPLVLYPIGVAVLVPSWLVIAHTRALLENANIVRTTAGLNAWLAVTLIALGLHNLPLAAPSLLNIGYRLHTRPAIGKAIVSAAVVFNVALFIGALMFMASGQSFEQFTGTE
jgi:hypothetical protein